MLARYSCRNSVCPSVCHTRALWWNEKPTADIMLPHKRAIVVVVVSRNCIAVLGVFFASFYGWEVISANMSKRAFFGKGWVILSANFNVTVIIRKLEGLLRRERKRNKASFDLCVMWHTSTCGVWMGLTGKLVRALSSVMFWSDRRSALSAVNEWLQYVGSISLINVCLIV